MRISDWSSDVCSSDLFQVMVYTSDDPIICKRLEEMGCVAVMPLAAPIGSGLGFQNKYNLLTIIENARVPIIVDAGVGNASDAAIAMERGCDRAEERSVGKGGVRQCRSRGWPHI